MERDELVERFSLERVGSTAAELGWMKGVYLRALAPTEHVERLVA